MFPRNASRVSWLALAALLTAQGLVITFAERAMWWGWAPGATGTLELAALYGSCIMSAAAAWACLGLRQPGLWTWSVSAGRDESELLRPALVWAFTAGCVAYSITALGLAAMTLPTMSPEAALRLALGWCTIIAVGGCAAAIGVACARFLPRFLALPVAAGLPFILVMALLFVQKPLTDALVVPSMRPNTYVWIGLGELVLRAVAVLSAAIGLFRMSKEFVVWPVVVSSVAVATLALSPLGQVQEIPTASDVHCQGQDPVICFDGAQVGTIDEYRDVLTATLDRFPREFRPDVVIATLRTTPLDGMRIAPVHGFTQPSLWINRPLVEALTVDALFQTACSSPDIQIQSAGWRLWWRDSAGLTRATRQYDELFPPAPSQHEEDSWAQAMRISTLEGRQRQAAMENALHAARTCQDQPDR